MPFLYTDVTHVLKSKIYSFRLPIQKKRFLLVNIWQFFSGELEFSDLNTLKVSICLTKAYHLNFIDSIK